MSYRNKNKKEYRLDHLLISEVIELKSNVLDLGCGNGDLLVLLRKNRSVKGQGVDMNESAIFQCVEKGLSVFHMDFESGLSSYPDISFDYVILNQSLQETLHVEFVLREALRVGKKVVMGFPNFAHIKARYQLFFKGVTPVTNALPHLWFNTPNLHFLSILDFEKFLTERKIMIIERKFFTGEIVIKFWPNLFAMNAIYVITKAKS